MALGYPRIDRNLGVSKNTVTHLQRWPEKTGTSFRTLKFA